jgi:hypothetical protein
MARVESAATKVVLALLIIGFLLFCDGQLEKAECCSTNYKDCITNASQCNTEQLCTEVCGGLFIEASRQNTSCLALDEDCSNMQSKCCGGLSCVEVSPNQTYQCLSNSTVLLLSPSNAPTKYQIESDTSNQTNSRVQQHFVKCCSINYKDCFTNSSCNKEQLCTDVCGGIFIEASRQNTSCLALDEDCSNMKSKCCGGLSCVEVSPNQTYQCLSNSTVLLLSPSNAPTKFQWEDPFSNQTDSQGQQNEAKCCSTNYKDCFKNSSCSTEELCTNLCGGVFIETSLQNTSCLALDEDCSNMQSKCCGGLSCVEVFPNQTYQCLSNSTVLSLSPSNAPTKFQRDYPFSNQTDSQGQQHEAKCCSTNYKDCFKNSSCSTEKLCANLCGGIFIETSRHNTSCLALDGDCSNMKSNCCDGLTCIEVSPNQTYQCLLNSTVLLLSPSNGPTKYQWVEQLGNQTEKQVQQGNAKCCSSNFRDCFTNSSCNTEELCTKACGGVFVNATYQNTSCLASSEDCSSNQDGCCIGLTCAVVSLNNTYQCVPYHTWPKLTPSVAPTVFYYQYYQTEAPSVKQRESGCCSFNYKYCSYNQYCNSNQTQCEAFCSGKWLSESHFEELRNCSGLNAKCGNLTDNSCCKDLFCTEVIPEYMW